MRITDFFKKTNTVGMHTTYKLTPLGKTKAEEYVASNPKAEVLAALNENGICNISEICDEVKSSPQKVKWIMRDLIKSGYVIRVTQED